MHNNVSKQKNIKFILNISCILILCSFSNLFAQQTKNILLVGNSVVYYNDMPHTLQKMIDEKEFDIKIDQRTDGGFGFYDHIHFVDSTFNTPHWVSDAMASTTVRKIFSKHWDMVILEPVGTYRFDINDTYEDSALVLLDSLIRVNSAKTVLFETYTKARYPVRYNSPPWTDLINKRQNILINTLNNISNLYCIDSQLSYLGTKRYSDSFEHSSEEYLEIKMDVDRAASTLRSGVLRVGYAYELCKIEYPAIPLYQSLTDTHPSPQASYLIACVLYKYITNSDLNNVTYRATLNEKEAMQIRSLINNIPSETP